MSDSLFLVDASHAGLAKNDWIRALLRIDGVSGSEPDDGDEWSGEIDDGSTLIMVRVTSHAVVFSRVCDLALQVAWTLRDVLRKPLHMFNEGYDFELSLDEFGSLQQLQAAVAESE